MQKIVYEKIHSAEFVGSIISHHKDLVYALTIERLHYIRELDFTRIAKEEGVDKSVVNRSVHRGLKLYA